MVGGVEVRRAGGQEAVGRAVVVQQQGLGSIVGAVEDLDAVEAAVGRRPEASTTGGTSDARFIRAMAPVLELGLVGQTMHQVDERAPVEEIRTLQRVYARIIERYFR